MRAIKRNHSRGINILTVSKYVFAAFYLYINWYKEVFGDSRILLYGLAVLLSGLAVIHYLLRRRLSLQHFPPILLTYAAYALYSLFSSMLLSKAPSASIYSDIVTFVAFSMISFCYWYISEQSGDSDWILTVFLIGAAVCAIQTILWGKAYYNGVYVTTMSAANNPNGLALTEFFGVFAAVQRLRSDKKPRIMYLSMIAVFSYTIVLSGSRKGFLVTALFILLSFLLPTLSREQKKFGWKDILYSGAVIIFFAVAAILVSQKFSATSMYERLLLAFTEGTDNVRWELYRDAFRFWEQHPLFGIGYNQYREYSVYGFYSHSSYAEILSCGGLIGMLIFFTPFIVLIVRMLRRTWKKAGISSRYLVLVLLLLAELELGLGMIFIYSFPHMLMLTYIFYEEIKESKPYAANKKIVI